MSERLFAKVKKEHRLIFSDDEIQQVSHLVPPVINYEIKFDSESKLHDDEWFYIEIDQEHQEMITEYSSNLKNTVGVIQLEKSDFSKVSAIYKISSNYYLWKKITAGKQLAPKHILRVQTNVLSVQETSEGIEISESVDAYYKTDLRKLYFKSFSRIRSLFDGIDDYYKIATTEEIMTFKDLGLASFTDNVEFKDRNQKTLKVILDDESIDLKNAEFKTRILPKLIMDFGNNEISLNDNGQVDISNNKQLTVLLTVLSGRRYKNPVTEDLTEATHTKKVIGDENEKS